MDPEKEYDVLGLLFSFGYSKGRKQDKPRGNYTTARRSRKLSACFGLLLKKGYNFCQKQNKKRLLLFPLPCITNTLPFWFSEGAGIKKGLQEVKAIFSSRSAYTSWVIGSWSPMSGKHQ